MHPNLAHAAANLQPPQQRVVVFHIGSVSFVAPKLQQKFKSSLCYIVPENAVHLTIFLRAGQSMEMQLPNAYFLPPAADTTLNDTHYTVQQHS